MQSSLDRFAYDCYLLFSNSFSSTTTSKDFAIFDIFYSRMANVRLQNSIVWEFPRKYSLVPLLPRGLLGVAGLPLGIADFACLPTNSRPKPPLRGSAWPASQMPDWLSKAEVQFSLFKPACFRRVSSRFETRVRPSIARCLTIHFRLKFTPH